MSYEIGPEHAAAQLAATVAFADSHAQPSRLRLYSEPAGAGIMLAEIIMAKPSGTPEGGAITLHPAEATTMIMHTGIPRSGRWVTGAGLLVVVGTVTDPEHDGFFKVVGSGTPEGDNSPMLYAGGLVVLDATALG